MVPEGDVNETAIGIETAFQDDTADLRVPSEKHAQHLGNGEREHSMGQAQQELLGEVFGEREGALLGAGGAEAVRWPAQWVKGLSCLSFTKNLN
jgi:hypothetical protein